MNVLQYAHDTRVLQLLIRSRMNLPEVESSRQFRKDKKPWFLGKAEEGSVQFIAV